MWVVAAGDPGADRKVDRMTSDWKEHHANEAGKAWTHPMVERVMQEYADNMGFDAKVGLPAYGMMKIAMYAAQVARAQALGFDPELLRLTAAHRSGRVTQASVKKSLAGASR